MFFRQPVIDALLFGTSSGAALYRETRFLEFAIQLPASGVHHGGVLQGHNLVFDDFIQVGDPLLVDSAWAVFTFERRQPFFRGEIVFLFVAGMTGHDQVFDAVAAAPTLWNFVLDFENGIVR